MDCDGTSDEILPLTNACYVRPNVLHGAPEPCSTPYVSLDIKYVLGPRRADGPARFLRVGHDESIGQGCSAQKWRGHGSRSFSSVCSPEVV